MRAIEQFQIRKIYAIGNALGIKASGNEDELHVLVGGVTGKESIKSLTYQEACAVIARLEELQGKTASPKPRSKKPKEHQSRPGGVTSGQQKKIWYLMYELKKYDEVPNDVQLGDRLCAVIKKEFGADPSFNPGKLRQNEDGVPFQGWRDFRSGSWWFCSY